MKINFKYIILLSIVIFITLNSYAQQGSYEKTIATWIYNVAYGVEWDDENEAEEFTIGVYNSKKVYDELITLAKERPIKGKPVKVYFYKRYKDIKDVHILYIGKKENGYLDVLFNIVKGSKTLMISDRAKSMQYTMINFLPIGGASKKRFEINNKNAEQQQLKISKTLLKLGGSNSVLRSLYADTEKELQKEKEELELKKKQILEQTALLEEQQAKIDKQRNEIKEKERLILIKEEEVKKQNRRLDSMTAEINAQRKKLKANLLVLAKQEKEIAEQQKEFQKAVLEQEKAMAEADSILKQKQEEIKKTDAKLNESVVTIENQKEENNILYGMLAIIAVLAFFTIKSAIKSKQDNKKLQEQNFNIKKQKEEIQSQSKQLELINGELEKLSIVASQTDNAVAIMDDKGNFEWVNAGFTRMYGYTLQLYRNEVDSNIINASANKEIKALIRKCIEDKETVVYEALNQKRDGTKIWVQTTLTPTVSEDGKVSRLIAIDTDINKAKLAEKEIKEQHKKIIEQARVLERQNEELERLSLVASETDNAIMMTDENGDFQWVNDAYTRMFGYDIDELKTKISKNIVSSKTSPAIKKYINKAKTELRSVDYEFQADTKFGHKIWIHTTLTPITDDKGQLKHLIAIDTDITNLKKAEFEIRQKSEELFAQSEELKLQNQRIEFQNAHIRSSINYAKTIQSAILPRVHEMAKFYDSFVIFKPKDIVSGDFYWFAHLPAKDGFSEKIFVAAIDCTGHGVPGAFMSMIANQILKETVLERKIVKPKEILEQLDTRVKSALRQDETENNDGMDLVLCRIEKYNDKQYRIKYSGAKRPLFYYRQGDEAVTEVKGDRRSIGGTMKKFTKIEFTDTEFIFNAGDSMWLSTDGYIDQNNPKRKRFGTPRLLNILNAVKDESLPKQKQILIETLEKYQDTANQRDDITLLGINFDGRW